jgi:hypothetical protein
LRNRLTQPIANEKQDLKAFQGPLKNLLTQPIAIEKQDLKTFQGPLKNLLTHPIATEKQGPKDFQSPEIAQESQRTRRDPIERLDRLWDRETRVRPFLVLGTGMAWSSREESDPQ